jgi:hypothetical protein
MSLPGTGQGRVGVDFAKMIYQVKQGDCINSIASEFGLNPNTVWQDAGQENIRDEIH